ncbi:MAG: hypothetical protein E5V91_24890 [Mesorhizobium sp.]|nr:hypothetical protein EJ068_27740 [Mesorhizobium sp. M2A.F.Ca.ET.043.02.1.1]RUW42113.1 hypothetical protein EOA37_06605 [Mesorhizobium sp. M2A.F.Ca.ET.015.02.1.1]RUW75002.1 hypothetical protein EOA28_16055 [Mesorhizobium sp. M2A.F.Ca.ET.067.02.1.1]RVC94612.1 hypothetical protein EN739_16490 [Mesorhizobium sp. M2A.F.Ca.ET.017.03.2.1]RVD02566.1 hypothetical protein EN753_22600 [Mesorhizobium sp. M2A.F.Ca.ET.029.05.1.1]RWB40919.1 MAG: hypothetical protein EOQ46_22930 [Mesorhizobium sp.]
MPAPRTALAFPQAPSPAPPARPLAHWARGSWHPAPAAAPACRPPPAPARDRCRSASCVFCGRAWAPAFLCWGRWRNYAPEACWFHARESNRGPGRGQPDSCIYSV